MVTKGRLTASPIEKQKVQTEAVVIQVSAYCVWPAMIVHVGFAGVTMIYCPISILMLALKASTC